MSDTLKINPQDATQLEQLEMENIALKLQLFGVEIRKLEERRRQIIEAVTQRKTLANAG